MNQAGLEPAVRRAYMDAVMGLIQQNYDALFGCAQHVGCEEKSCALNDLAGSVRIGNLKSEIRNWKFEI